MPRREFTRKTKALRAAHAGGLCEYCGLKPKKPEYHHYKEAEDGGDNSFENCRFVCDDPCHKILTAKYKTEKSKAERVRDKANGSLKSKQPMRYRKSEKRNRATRPVDKLAGLPRRKVFEAAE